MYQSVIRDPGGSGLIRVWTDDGSTVVNGSTLTVPPGTTAFVSINGRLSPPKGPGKYELYTGVDPFVVKLKHILTKGDTGTDVTVFFVSTEKNREMRFGTGQFPFREHRYLLTMNALAACSLTYSICDPKKVIEKLVGSGGGSAFSDEEMDAWIKQLALPVVKESISRVISQLDVPEFNSHLSQITDISVEAVRSKLVKYGIELGEYSVLGVDTPDSEKKRLDKFEEVQANNALDVSHKVNILTTIYEGDVPTYVVGEILGGQDQLHPGVAAGTSKGAAGDMASMMTQMMMMQQVGQWFMEFREPLYGRTRHQPDMLKATPHDQERISSAEGSPPMSKPLKRCPSCNGSVGQGARVCPICGYVFPEEG